MPPKNRYQWDTTDSEYEDDRPSRSQKKRDSTALQRMGEELSALGPSVLAKMPLTENIRAAIGPNIGMCHFETDHDVPDAMRAAFGPEVDAYIEKRGKKYHLDLKQINAMVLRRCGVEHIDLSRDCTVCSCDRFWSHRATGGERGSQGAVIVCREVTG